MPVRELINHMYRGPESLELLVHQRQQVMLPEREWSPLAPRLDGTSLPGYVTPEFGGIATEALSQSIGLGDVVWGAGPVWPCWPEFLLRPQGLEKVLTASTFGRPRPISPLSLPLDFTHRVDERGHNFIIRWS